MWIHLSKRENLSRFVISEKDENQEIGIFALTIPEQSYGETEIPRKCVAPTLWQCCIGVSKTGHFYVYSVVIESPELADDTVQDKHITNEHWITENVIHEFGEPVCKKIGSIQISTDNVNQLKVAAAKDILPKEYENEGAIWDRNEDLYILKPGVMDLLGS